MMSDLKSYIQGQIYSMKIGQELKISRRTMNEAFPCGWPSIYNTPVESLLSSLIGSGCGAFRASEDLMTGDVTVSRHEESDKRYYVDPDRAWMYEKNSDGTFTHKYAEGAL